MKNHDILLVLFLSAALTAAEEINVQNTGDGIVVSGYGIDGSEYLECNDSCEISFDLEDESETVYFPLDCNYSDIGRVLEGLNRSVFDVGGRVSGMNLSCPTCPAAQGVTQQDLLDLRDYIKNNGDENKAWLHDQVLASINAEEDMQQQLEETKFALLNMSSQLEYERLKTSMLYQQNLQYASDQGDFIWIIIGLSVVSLIAVSSPYMPELLRRLGMTQAYKGMRKGGA
jgi:hypothetical protein